MYIICITYYNNTLVVSEWPIVYYMVNCYYYIDTTAILIPWTLHVKMKDSPCSYSNYNTINYHFIRLEKCWHSWTKIQWVCWTQKKCKWYLLVYYCRCILLFPLQYASLSLHNVNYILKIILNTYTKIYLLVSRMYSIYHNNRDKTSTSL